MELTILRNGKSRDLKVRVAKRPSRGRNKFSSRGKKRRSQTDLGMEVSDLTYQEALERGLPKSIRGAVVRTVRPGGPAHAAGIMPKCDCGSESKTHSHFGRILSSGSEKR